MGVPRLPPDLPQRVSVTNWPPRPNYAQDFFNNVKREYENLRGQANENQVAVLRYHSPAGEVIRVTQVSLYQRNGTLIFYGDDGNNPCVVLAQAQSVQLVMKILTAEEVSEPERRRPIGFVVEDPEQ